ncbi:hypothetical protein I307_01852 [Cryptococcus deuterogattii 99/473]|uniref:SH3 domain-containing protein n=1 Tax=Cryptococcus deuterogattii Ram5 TaxID=1296110 RepID=A0A0D0V1D5_9TREE|nr:hypothetical protein I352_02560 [Cryptococcus deuterogattii MMRL2647]KIR40299.1 hypothetical protein I313_03622 [Cryptococcus deuterogattii Ram5]KIR99840.1 hypothetical protein L804_02475 [Cryptococcus deuterogattii 2001/935-1]KIY58540.1 hypothetical protein I307_01852 [Cryptococcus deuterogattii 99/473]
MGFNSPIPVRLQEETRKAANILRSFVDVNNNGLDKDLEVKQVLSGNLSVAVGPLGRNAEGSGALNAKGQVAAMYSYSKTKGLFGGVSVEGSVILERQDANRLAYGGSPSSKQILSGMFDPPEWADVLIDQLEKSTGMPGGQRWLSRDEEGEGGGMGWSTPEAGRGGGGYVFGEGVGAGGSVGSGRKRAGSLFSKDPDRSNSPSRPGMPRRSSILNPFSSGNSSPRKGSAGPHHTSEAYNAGLTWDSQGSLGVGAGNAGASAGRARSGSLRTDGEVPQPFSYMTAAKLEGNNNKDLLGEWDSATFNSTKSRSRNNSDGGDRDLLGQWDSNGHGLSAQFNRLSTSDTRSRSNSRSNRPPFDDILEYPKKPSTSISYAHASGEPDYNPRESISNFAKTDWSSFEDQQRYDSPSKKTRSFSSYISPMPKSSSSKDFSPFDEDGVGRLRSTSANRPFEDYHHQSDRYGSPSHEFSPRRLSGASPKPEIRLKPGLDTVDDGYARAVAMFDFKPGAAGDLGFKAGDVVIVLDYAGDSSEWWEGRLASEGSAGRKGIFPCTYVEVLGLPKDLRGGVSRSDLRRRIARNEFD